ncbi:TonB-dependent receptor [Parabacteroides sp. OttesenSCG-928-O15]|nr:TonB-dependent receptor [Parabacteroides sp. OttesenSCG-928-O15]
MRISFFFLFVCAFQLVATNTDAQNTKIELHSNTISVRQLISEIEKQTDYLVLFRNNDVDVNRLVHVDNKNNEVTAHLEAAFKDTNIDYEFQNKYIVLSQKSREQAAQLPQQSGRSITGTIVDERGEPIIGANVMEQGTTNGIVTDVDGKFALTVSPNAVLIVTYVGYLTQRINTAGRNSLSIVLSEDMQTLEEIVVVGYGSQKKANLTGAVNTVKSDQIANKPVTSLVSALAGEAAGVTVTQRSGQPGPDQGEIRIRGVGTWGNAAPLVLVDGISMDINNVVPSEVESVSILKDAASASIYGSRAANGVILITTKQGEKGKIKLNYDGNIGFQTPTRIPEMVSSWQYAELYNQGMANEGRASDLFPAERIARMKAGGDPDRLEGNTDWYKEALNWAAPQQIHQVSATGGNDRMTYMGMLGYSNQQGIIPSTSYERFNTRINTKTQLTSWLNLAFNMSYINGTREEPADGAQNAFMYIARALPHIPTKFSDGTWSYYSIQKNPIRFANGDYGLNKISTSATSVQISPEITPIKGLLIKGVLGYESNTVLNKTFNKIVEYEDFEPAGQSSLLDGARNKQTDRWSLYRNLTANASATYEIDLGKNSFKVLLGASAESFKYAYTLASRQDFPNNDFTEINAGDPNTSAAEGNSTYSALVSAFGRLNYVYDDKYLFEANFRYDGSSKFARGNRFGLFPSFSVGWRLSEEAFFENLKAHIPNLKLRASWGKLGNQQISDYQYLSTFGSSGAYLFNGAINSGYAETVMGNQAITWETAKNYNIGIDFSLFDNRLQTVFDWYKRDTEDILLALKAPATLGISPSMQNAGSVENKGWELSINWQDKINKDFSYRVGFNLSDVKNKITDLRGYKSPTNSLTIRIEGQPIDALFGWETLGICVNEEQFEEHKAVMRTYNGNWNIGDLIIHDRSKDGKIGAEDKIVMGNQIPRFTFGVNLGFEYKKLDFSCFFQGVGKADGYVTNIMLKPLNNISARMDHYTDSFNPADPNPKAYYPRLLATYEYNYDQNLSYWVQDASYIRLKNVQLGYTFNFPKLGIEKLRLMFSGENVFTLTNFIAWDPETRVGSSSMYPLVAVYSFGVNVTF